MSAGFQESLFLPVIKNDWKAPTDFPRWWEAKSVTIDLETRDPDLKAKGPGWYHKEGGEVVGIAVECEGDSRYYPIAHKGGGNLPRDMVLQWVRDVASSNGEKVFFNASYDIGWLGTCGIDVRGRLFDAAAGAALLDESRSSYTLDAISMDYTRQGKDETALKEAAMQYGINANNPEELKASLWRLPANAVGPYAEGDVRTTRALAEVQRPLLANERLESLMTLECALIPCLVAMRQQGVRVDQDAAAQLRIQLSQSMIAMGRQQILDYGKRIDPYSNNQISAKCDQLGVYYPTTDKGNASFKKEWLETQTHPFLQHIQEMRKLQTNQSLLESIVYQYMTPEGRIHCNFNALKSDDGGTVTGRFSSSKPNLQQVPFRHPIWGPAFRGLFIPDEGARWGSADYSQQEYRLIVHFAKKLRLAGAKEAARMYAKEGADFHAIIAKMIDRPRWQAKNINFGMAYTMGEEKLAAQLGLPLDEARVILTQYHDRAPFIKKLTEATSNVAARRGYIRTIGGRKCRFDEWEPMNAYRMDPRPYPAKSRDEAIERWGQQVQRAYLHKACNRVIQGGGADITKRSLLQLWEAKITPLLQVHDEIDWNVENDRQPEYVREVMEHTTETEPRMVVDISLGDNWAEAH